MPTCPRPIPLVGAFSTSALDGNPRGSKWGAQNSIDRKKYTSTHTAWTVKNYLQYDMGVIRTDGGLAVAGTLKCICLLRHVCIERPALLAGSHLLAQ